jgi:hypothetical protein
MEVRLVVWRLGLNKLTPSDQVVIYYCCIWNEIIQVFQFDLKNNEWRALNNNNNNNNNIYGCF